MGLLKQAIPFAYFVAPHPSLIAKTAQTFVVVDVIEMQPQAAYNCRFPHLQLKIIILELFPFPIYPNLWSHQVIGHESVVPTFWVFFGLSELAEELSWHTSIWKRRRRMCVKLNCGHVYSAQQLLCAATRLYNQKLLRSLWLLHRSYFLKFYRKLFPEFRNFSEVENFRSQRVSGPKKMPCFSEVEGAVIFVHDFRGLFGWTHR